MAFDETIFPTNNDVAATAGNGKKLDEEYLASKWGAAMSKGAGTHAISGSAGTAPVSGLTQTIPDGEYFIEGYYVDLGGSDTITVTASNTHYIYVQLTRDGSDHVNGAQLTSNTTGVRPSEAVRVGVAVADATDITSYTDDRKFAGTYSAAMYVSAAGSHNSSGAWQKVGSGGGTTTWASDWDIRPSGVSAQVDVTTNDRIDIQVSGLYAIDGLMYMTGAADGTGVGCGIYVNGVARPGILEEIGAAASPTVSTAVRTELNAGDYVELYGYQNGGGSLNYGAGQWLLRVSATRVGDLTDQ